MNILVIVPRYHTNLIGFIKFFKKKNYKVDMHVKYIFKNEYHYNVKPKVLNKSILNLLFKWRKNFFLPNLFKYYKYIKDKKYDLIIFRYTDHISSLIFLIFFKILGYKLIIYEQSQTIQKVNFNLLKKITDFFKKKLSVAIISPIAKSNKNNYFLPFITKIKKKKNINKVRKILFVGRYEKRKRHLEFLDIVYDLKKNFNFKVNFVGQTFNKSNEDYFKKLKKKIYEYELSKYVNVKKNIEFNKMKKIYETNDLLILPSIKEDASVSIIEAIGFGLGIITTKSNGTSCFVKNNFNGFTINDDSFHDLKLKLKRVLDNRSLIEKFSINSNKIVKNYLSEKIFEKNWKEIIKKI